MNSVKFKCNICYEEFAYKGYRDKHVKVIHLGKKFYSCELCEKEFTFQKGLFSHLQYWHKSTDKIECNLCEKYFPNQELLNVHVKDIHEVSKIKSHKCTLFWLFSKKSRVIAVDRGTM